jgi:hypothetical protein
MASSPRGKVGRKKRRKRDVYIVARGLRAAGRFAPLSDGKLPLCHWALLITSQTQWWIQTQLVRFSESNGQSELPPWGTLFELSRTLENKVSHRKSRGFSLQEWHKEWGTVSMTYVGTTKVTDHMLVAKGAQLTSID